MRKPDSTICPKRNVRAPLETVATRSRAYTAFAVIGVDQDKLERFAGGLNLRQSRRQRGAYAWHKTVDVEGVYLLCVLREYCETAGPIDAELDGATRLQHLEQGSDSVDRSASAIGHSS